MIENLPGVFDPETLAVLSRAFDQAWDFVRADPEMTHHDPGTVRLALASCLFGVANQGERNAVRLANAAIGKLRALKGRSRQKRRSGSRS